MTDKLNFIAGEWTAGDGFIDNRSPSEVSDLVGPHAQAGVKQRHEAVVAKASCGAVAPGLRRALEAYAARTYVPASAQSRGGAGGGSVDGD